MIWHTATVPAAGLPALLSTISGNGGVITSSRPEAHGVLVTWTTTSAWA